MNPGFEHRPVMVDEVVEVLRGVGPGLVIDGTVGGGGHSAALLEATTGIEIVGLDRDADAVAAARTRLAAFGARAEVRQANFAQIAEVADADPRPLVGVLLDLGVSSPQLDRAERGFSHRGDGPLDMRMDRRQTLTAATVVNEYEPAQLVDLLRHNADEPHARRIVEAIVAARPLHTTAELADVVRAAVPAAARRARRHPAMRTFQAIRIEVNAELDVIESAVTGALDALEPGGRLVVLSYHSGEDRIVKHVLRRAADGVCECPAGLPCLCGAGPTVRLLRRKVTRPTEAEVESNPRAASARLRAAERLPVEG